MKTPKSFEEGIQRLQELMKQLQDEATPLAKSIKLYAEAAELIRYCNESLQNAKVQIDEIDAKLVSSLPEGED